MSIRRSVLSAAIAAVCCLVVASSASAATTVIRTDPGGARVTSGAVITGTSEGPATLTLDSTGSITCHGSFQGVLSATDGNPSVSATMPTFAMAGCSDTLPIVSIDTCSRHGFGVFTMSATSSLGGTFNVLDINLFCHVAGTGTPGTGCYFTLPSSTGSFTNSNSTLGFGNVPLAHTVPSGTTNDIGAFCGNTGAFNANFANVHTTGGAGGRITLATS
jgi:hypothetical protein